MSHLPEPTRRSNGLEELSLWKALTFPIILGIAGWATFIWEMSVARFLPRRVYGRFDFSQHPISKEKKWDKAG